MNSTLDLMSPAAMSDPASVYDALYAGPRIHRYQGFTPPFYIAYRYHDVETMLRDASTFTSGQGQGPNFTQPSGVVSDRPDHSFYRGLVQDAFQPAAVASLKPRLEEIATEALESVAGKPEWDLHDGFALPLPIRIICEILGVPTDDIWQFKAWSDASVAALAAEDRSAYSSDTEAMASYILGLIAKRRATPDDSLISRIANGLRDGEAIPDSEAVSLTSQMFVAGNETTTSLITNFAWRLSRLGLWHDYQKDSLDLDSAINESLRYDPPLLALFRTTARQVSFGDCVVPAGAKVMMHFGAANRDPEVFDEPNSFRPDRQGARIMSFGLGIHSCLGKELARLEANVALTALRDHYPQLEVTGDGQRIPPFIFWGRSKLPVKNLAI